MPLHSLGVLQPGDIVVVRTPGGFPTPQWWIRLGAALQDKPNLDNHVAMMHHYDSQGVPWGFEGKPGGVGQVDMRSYIASGYTVNNCGQPGRTDADRAKAADLMKSMEGTKYDWQAIGGDGLMDLHVHLWNDVTGFNPNLKPGEVVCSSFGAYVYEVLKWAHPDMNTERVCQPADWESWCVSNQYSLKLT
jgi:hypothetical protein